MPGGGKYTCDRSSAVVQSMDGVCRVATTAVNGFLKGQGYITVHLERGGDARLEFLKEDGATKAWSSIFACTGHDCQQTRDPQTGAVLTDCHGHATCVVRAGRGRGREEGGRRAPKCPTCADTPC
jgi:hypothetical protein